ncbi:hypothetical protein AVEN_122042-1 [Araneus ventricosus]|uniref:Uncharacterized protein n=1 Tax=Araneus ventricosus TaxID=182803 RepID=A0A4Y2F1I5_ARAVE|nr:hypothetical protein AVEN_122042-1 [Araneus ventricosus]
MLLSVRHTDTKKKRMESLKKHDMKYFCCLRSNDGDGKMEFQGFSDSCEVEINYRELHREKGEVSFAADQEVRDTGHGKRKPTKDFFTVTSLDQSVITT